MRLFIFIISILTFYQSTAQTFGKNLIEDSLSITFYLPLISNSVPENHSIPILKGEPEIKDLAKAFYFFNPATIDFTMDKGPKRNALMWESMPFFASKSPTITNKPRIKYTKNDLLESGYLEEDINDDMSINLLKVNPTPLFQPFYFKRHEVTNGEYQEFVNWVRDSVAHTYLRNEIDWEMELDYSDETLKELSFLKDGRRKFHKHIFVYNYKNENNEFIHINIYPDSMVWITDHVYSYNEPMTKNYSNHPAYKDFPVVGITYHQALAFCDWKQRRLKEQYPSAKYELEVGLPTAYEWQWIAGTDGNQLLAHVQDKDFNTDLMITHDDNIREVAQARNQAQSYIGNYAIDGSMYTKKADERRTKQKDITPYADLDNRGISGMSGNVSEWMADDYSYWIPLLERKIKLWKQRPTPESTLAIQIAEYYLNQCDKNGQLVYGANWVDERFSNIQGKNKAGLYAKTFLSPDTKHSTLGFRYVIRIKAK